MDIFVELQKLLPQKLITAAAGILASVRYRPVKNWLIQTFVRAYGVDMREANVLSIDQFASFNDFFTRELRPGTRPLAESAAAILSPADGELSELGRIRQGQLLQAKGRGYSLAGLLQDASLAEQLEGGIYATVYLSPRDYHRVHMPLAGKPLGMTYLPGKLFSVNQRTANSLDGLFAGNERLVALFEHEPSGEPFVLVMVGAMIVGGMETVLTGPVSRSRRVRNLDVERAELARGEELGRFYLGSTAILLCPPGLQGRLDEALCAGKRVRMGEQIGLVEVAAGPGR